MRASELVPRGWPLSAGPRPWVWAWLAMLPVAVLRAGQLAESDTFWQIRAGQYTLDHRAIPTADFMSWSMPGRAWTLNSWGFNVVLASLDDLAGLPGVALGCALLIMLTSALVLRLARHLGASPNVAALVLVLASATLLQWLSARPHIVDYAAVLLLVLLLRDQDRPTWRAALLVGLLCLVWVNLHAAVLLGLSIIGATGALMLARRETRQRVPRFAAVFGAATVGAVLNPYGLGLVHQTVAVKAASTTFITEWQHADLTDPLQLLMLLIGCSALVFAARRHELVFVAALTVCLLGSVSAIRVLPILVLVALPLHAQELSRPAVLDFVRRRRVVLLGGLAVVVVMAAVGATHLGRPTPTRYPGAAVMSAIPAGARIYNSYQLGGYVELRRPDVRVSVDSRSDLYGEDYLATVQRTLQGKGDIDAALAGADAAVISTQEGLATRLRRDPGWRLAASDDAALVFTRTGGR